jgi:AcrR family transcriptional regulator
MEKDISTEEKILITAKQIFISKGFEGCTTREIAKQSGINIALINYYFCSKKLLFKQVFKSVMQEFAFSLTEVFRMELSLKDKFKIFIEKEYDFLASHPDIPKFIISELGREEKFEFDPSKAIEKIAETGLFKELLEAQEAGVIRKMSLTNLMMLIVSNCQYPFVGKPLMMHLNKLEDKEYSEMLVLQKQYVTDMLVSYLFLNEEK